jgi:hypothetical protein
MITRDNYEEFFLLYIDNELPAADRKVVEQFVEENPDLEEEWEALLQCRIKPDPIGQPVFANKGLLMKFEDAAPVEDKVPKPGHGQFPSGKSEVVSLTVKDNNYEEYFLSYVDGELNEKDLVSVEEFVRLHPSKGRELEQLLQTISRPDPAVIFPDKESLYKRDSGTKIIFPWWRVAAAAVVLGAVGLLFLYHPKKEGPSLANGKGGVHSRITPQGPASPGLAETSPKKENDKKEKATVTPAAGATLYSSGDPKGLAAADRTRKKRTDDAATTQKIMMEAAPVATQKMIAKTVPVATQKMIAKAAPAETAEHQPISIAATDPGRVPGPGTTVDAIDRAVNPGEAVIAKEKSSFATQALLNNSTASEDDDNFETESASTKKSKFRGIFRRVSRAFEKTADRGEDGQRKVLIGAFQIALK